MTADNSLETTEPVMGLTYFPNEAEEEAAQICTCEHRLFQHSQRGCRWTGGEQICTCAKFQRKHLGRRPNCWCYGTGEEAEHPDEAFVSSSYVQKALDQVRDDLELLRIQLQDWGNTEDLNSRVENWHSNIWRHMEEILQQG